MFGFKILSLFILVFSISSLEAQQSAKRLKVTDKTVNRFRSKHFFSTSLVYWEDKIFLTDTDSTENEVIVNARAYKFAYTFARHNNKLGFYGGIDLTWGVASAGSNNNNITYFQEDLPVTMWGAHLGYDLWRTEETMLTSYPRYNVRNLSVDSPSEGVEVKDDSRSFFGLGLEGSLKITDHYYFVTEVTKYFDFSSIQWGLGVKYSP